MKKALLSTSEYLEGIRKGDKMIIGKAITLIESTLDEHQRAASELLSACQEYAGNSIRIGVTGVPGVGKSTFIEAFGKYLIKEQNKRVGVLAIDPSSKRSQGSILGDKTRMDELSMNVNAFVRPSPSGGSLGGVRQTTHNTITILEAAGFDVILIETVGVGQSETLVHQMVDFFLLLMLAGAGDSLQGIKRGIMEMADAMVINKADGDNLEPAKKACREYQMALGLLPQSRPEWNRRITFCSSTEEMGLDRIWKIISEFLDIAKGNGSFDQNRLEQLSSQFRDDWFLTLQSRFNRRANFEERYNHYQEQVRQGKMSSLEAANLLFDELGS